MANYYSRCLGFNELSLSLRVSLTDGRCDRPSVEQSPPEVPNGLGLKGLVQLKTIETAGTNLGLVPADGSLSLAESPKFWVALGLDLPQSFDKLQFPTSQLPLNPSVRVVRLVDPLLNFLYKSKQKV